MFVATNPDILWWEVGPYTAVFETTKHNPNYLSKGAEILTVGFIAVNSSMLANIQLKGSGLFAVASQKLSPGSTIASHLAYT